MAIIFGTIAAIVIYFIYFLNIFIIPALISGLVAGYFTSKGNYLKSILYGAFTSLIGISIGYVITNIIYNSIFSIESTYISIQPLQFIEIVLLAIVLGAIGGLIQSCLRKRYNLNDLIIKNLNKPTGIFGIFTAIYFFIFFK